MRTLPGGKGGWLTIPLALLAVAMDLARGQGKSDRLDTMLTITWRRGPDLPWQALDAAAGPWQQVAACLLLADRSGAASRSDIETFLRVVAGAASELPAECALPDAHEEAARAEELDRFCADLDVQIGLTILRSELGQIAGTRLRGVAEAVCRPAPISRSSNPSASPIAVAASALWTLFRPSSGSRTWTLRRASTEAARNAAGPPRQCPRIRAVSRCRQRQGQSAAVAEACSR